MRQMMQSHSQHQAQQRARLRAAARPKARTGVAGATMTPEDELALAQVSDYSSGLETRALCCTPEVK